MTDKTTNDKTTEQNSPNPGDHRRGAGTTWRRASRLRQVDQLGRREQAVPAGAEDRAGRQAVRTACRRRHADHADRHARGSACQRLEPGARAGERALKFWQSSPRRQGPHNHCHGNKRKRGQIGCAFSFVQQGYRITPRSTPQASTTRCRAPPHRAIHAGGGRSRGRAAAAPRARAPSSDQRRRLPAPAAGSTGRRAGRRAPRNRRRARAARTIRTGAELGQLAVRNGDAVADGGRAELFALQQNFQNRFFALSGQFGCARGKLLNRLLLVIDLERRNDGVRRNEIGKRHGRDR